MSHKENCPVCQAMDAKGITGAKRVYLHQLIDLEFMADRVACMAEDEGIIFTQEEVEDMVSATCLIDDGEDNEDLVPARRLN